MHQGRSLFRGGADKSQIRETGSEGLAVGLENYRRPASMHMAKFTVSQQFGIGQILPPQPNQTRLLAGFFVVIYAHSKSWWYITVISGICGPNRQFCMRCRSAWLAQTQMQSDRKRLKSGSLVTAVKQDCSWLHRSSRDEAL